MKAKLIKTSTDYYHLVIEKSNYYYGHTSPEFCELQNKDGSYTHKLSLKNCQAIERGYDLDELAKIEYPICEVWNDEEALIRELAFKKGFQKALEILGDKRFSEKDIKNAIEYGIQSVLQAIPGVTSTQSILDAYKQALQQTEWDVEVEMGYVGECNGNNDNGCFQDSSGHNCGCFKRKPKLDADGCLILEEI
jgi:hypothetical protein